jgi:hypothetical protein
LRIEERQFSFYMGVLVYIFVFFVFLLEFVTPGCSFQSIRPQRARENCIFKVRGKGFGKAPEPSQPSQPAPLSNKAKEDEFQATLDALLREARENNSRKTNRGTHAADTNDHGGGSSSDSPADPDPVLTQESLQLALQELEKLRQLEAANASPSPSSSPSPSAAASASQGAKNDAQDFFDKQEPFRPSKKDTDIDIDRLRVPLSWPQRLAAGLFGGAIVAIVLTSLQPK